MGFFANTAAGTREEFFKPSGNPPRTFALAKSSETAFKLYSGLPVKDTNGNENPEGKHHEFVLDTSNGEIYFDGKIFKYSRPISEWGSLKI